MELGFYSGCIRMWRQLAAQQALVVGERADRAIRSCEELLLSYPMCNPQVRLATRLQAYLAPTLGSGSHHASLPD